MHLTRVLNGRCNVCLPMTYNIVDIMPLVGFMEENEVCAT